jgi:uncharacterized protein YneF (UPF0154 family)
VNTDTITSLVSAIAYGGIGLFIGFLVGVTVADRHQIQVAILEGDPDQMPEPRGLLRGPDRLQRLIVILVMVALLLAGLGWLQASKQEKKRQQDNCELLRDMTQVLRDRSLANEDQASYNRQVWTDLRRIIVKGGQSPKSPVIVSIDKYLASQREYARKVNATPYPQPPEGCQT